MAGDSGTVSSMKTFSGTPLTRTNMSLFRGLAANLAAAMRGSVVWETERDLILAAVLKSKGSTSVTVGLNTLGTPYSPVLSKIWKSEKVSIMTRKGKQSGVPFYRHHGP